MNLNKLIGIWRGSNTPPTTTHMWVKEDNSIHFYVNDLWLNLLDIIGNASEEEDGFMSKEDKHSLDLLLGDFDNYAKTTDEILETILQTLIANKVVSGSGINVTYGNNTQVSVKLKPNDILSVSNAGLDAEVSVKKYTEDLPSNVLELYKVEGKGGTLLGEAINIYKDRSLKKVELIDLNLVFTYTLEDGTEKDISIDISKFISELEFGDGLGVSDHKIIAVKHPDSENFLDIDSDGIKISGIGTAITDSKKLPENYEMSDLTNPALNPLDTYDTAFSKLEKLINENKNSIILGNVSVDYNTLEKIESMLSQLNWHEAE